MITNIPSAPLLDKQSDFYLTFQWASNQPEGICKGSPERKLFPQQKVNDVCTTKKKTDFKKLGSEITGNQLSPRVTNYSIASFAGSTPVFLAAQGMHTIISTYFHTTTTGIVMQMVLSCKFTIVSWSNWSTWSNPCYFLVQIILNSHF